MKASQYTPILFLLLLSLNITSCKKFIEVDPPATSINEGNVYENDGTAISAVIGIYTDISINDFAGMFSYFPELSADNLTLLNTNQIQYSGYYLNDLLAGDNGETKPWARIYPEIFTCNAAIEGLNRSSTLTPTVKQNLLGQVYFLRAFFYFYLTNFYGDVPLALTTDYTVNNSLKRASADQVNSQIIDDLQRAKSLLPEGYLTGDMKTVFGANGQRVVANRFAASALLARVYLYQKDFANAELMASEVIAQSSLYSSAIPLDQIFLKDSKETIFALQPATAKTNSGEAELYVLRKGEPAVNTARSSFLTPAFMDAFQTGDQRKAAWIGMIENQGVLYPYPAKYKALFNTNFTEQSILIRLGEIYLIRAEARIQQNKVADGVSDLNVLRERATDKSETNASLRLKPLATSLSKEEAISALNYERRVELFSECGHRWFDLRRTGQLDAAMIAANKGGTWAGFKAFYPLPSNEIVLNPNLTQNTGYTN
ncbi:RagB/SusD family nutrient uptake outer membrane protein [Pedobacter sp. JY14-1]|uniref:RagB/SusD family nutrient uptake outer membrane protein n=1 Tax=Pedobacter sp. JY14-1 TaxID=3034151 RepID=UPI0023E20516|nr:RagB/SusD family nutrient uptake outer membrane protein [Pedobacter sp. JY14-1]